MIKDRSYDELLRYAWRFQKAGAALFVTALAAVFVLIFTGHRVGVEVGGLPVIWALLAMQSLMRGQFLLSMARLQARIDMLTMHKAQRFAAGQGKHVYVGSGDTVVLTNTCGHEVTIRARSAAHLEIG